MGKNKYPPPAPRCEHNRIARKCESCELQLLRQMAYAHKGEKESRGGEEAVDFNMAEARWYEEWLRRFG